MGTFKIKETIEKEINVQFPCYRKNENNYFKVINQEISVQVSDYFNEDHNAIIFRNPNAAFYEDTENSSKEEFEKVFEKVMHQLSV